MHQIMHPLWDQIHTSSLVSIAHWWTDVTSMNLKSQTWSWSIALLFAEKSVKESMLSGQCYNFIKIPFLITITVRTSKEHTTTGTLWYWRWHLVLLVPQVQGPSTMSHLFVGAIMIAYLLLWKKKLCAFVNMYDTSWVYILITNSSAVAHFLWSAILLSIKNPNTSNTPNKTKYERNY
jgi:hypothetical protein